MPKVEVERRVPVKPRRSGGSVIDRIAPISFEDDDGIKMLVYGQSGSGKTTFWATFPGKILCAVCSGGNRTGELRSVNTPEYRKKISSVVLQSVAEAKEIVDHAGDPENGYKTLVLDHVSGLQDMALKEILGIDELPAQKSWGLASQQQYGQCTMQCKEILRAMLNLSINVVIIGQERTSRSDDETGGSYSELLRPTVGVATTPSLAGWLNPACDYVVQMFKRPVMVRKTTKIGDKAVTTETRGKGVEYCLRCEPHDVYATKFRVPRGREIPDVIVDPSYDKVIKYIQG